MKMQVALDQRHLYAECVTRSGALSETSERPLKMISSGWLAFQQSTTLTARPPRLVSLYLVRMSSPV